MAAFKGYMKGKSKDYVTRLGTYKSGMNVCIRTASGQEVDVYAHWDNERKEFYFNIYQTLQQNPPPKTHHQLRLNKNRINDSVT